MYVIQNIKNKMYFRLNIDKNTKHLVFNLDEAKKIRSKKEADKILNSFNCKENYEIIKAKK